MTTNERTARAHKVLDDMGVTPDRTNGTYEDQTATPDRLLLVEESTIDGTWHITTHESTESACAYIDGQEYPEDWRPAQLVDLDTGERHVVEQTTHTTALPGTYDFGEPGGPPS